MIIYNYIIITSLSYHNQIIILTGPQNGIFIKTFIILLYFLHYTRIIIFKYIYIMSHFSYFLHLYIHPFVFYCLLYTFSVFNVINFVTTIIQRYA